MNTVPSMVPRDTFIAVYVMSNRRHGTLYQREKSLKKYRRDWKINLIERDKPCWNNFYMALAS